MQSWFVTGETVHSFMTQEMLGWRCKAQVTPTCFSLCMFRWPRRNHPPPRMTLQFTFVNHCSNNVDLLQPMCVCVFDLTHFQFRKLFGRCYWTICKIGYCSVAMLFARSVNIFPPRLQCLRELAILPGPRLRRKRGWVPSCQKELKQILFLGSWWRISMFGKMIWTILYLFIIVYIYICLLLILYKYHISINDIHYHCQHHHIVHGEGLGNPHFKITRVFGDTQRWLPLASMSWWFQHIFAIQV